jgi:TP901 family phage tail tape measure protein
MPSTVKISAEFVGLSSSLEKQIRAATGTGGLKIPINDKAFNAALGGMTGNLRRFEQSLDFSNRRVIAFGTSASIVYGTVRAFNELVKATVNVEKRMASINSIFTLSARNLDSFSKSLFNVARETGQSFDEVAKAAEELSRQGLGVQETLKRTRDAMILTRLTGLDTAKSVETLTAAVNTYGRAGEDTTTIINKLVAVDQRFAVSARDLAEAFQRAGSVAADAGLSIDEFIGYITAAQQITQRGGAVISNAFKTIFTRLERSSTLDQLEALGVGIRDAEGNAKSAGQVFNALADAYKNMTRENQQQVAQLGAGVFQINQFKALMQDLGRNSGIKDQATAVAANQTNEAIIRNAALNDTLATSVQNLKTSATQMAAVVGSLSLKPLLMEGISTGNIVANLFKNAKATGDTDPAKDFGAYVGESILKGIGNVLAGPGLIFILRTAMGLLRKTIPEVAGDIKAGANMFMPGTMMMPIGTRSNVGSRLLQPVGEAEAISRTNQLLTKGTEEEQKRYMAARTVADQEKIILEILQRQAVLVAEIAGIKRGAQASILAQEAKLGAAATRTAYRPGSAAGGYIPIGEEASAIARGIGGAPAGARPVYLPNFARGDGRGIVANSSEWVAPTPKGPAILNRDMITRHGLPPGSTPVAAEGYLPNAANNYNVPPSYRIRPNPPLIMGQPWGAPMSPAVPSTPTASATGQGFGQFLGAYTGNSAQIAKTVESIVALTSALAKADTARGANALKIITDSTRRAGGPGSIIESRPWSGQPYVMTDLRGRPMTSTPDENTPGLHQGEVRARQRAAMDAALATRAAEQAQVLADNAIAARASRRAGRASSLQNGLLIGSLASGFIPQGEGGTASGQVSGAIGGGLQGAAIGASIGSVFGPIGTFVGAGVGGLTGAISGFLSRAEKSLAEVAEEVNKQTAKIKEQMDATVQAFEDIDTFNEGKASGLNAKQLLRLQQRSQASLGKVTDPQIRSLILNGNRAEATRILSDRAEEESAQGAMRIAMTGAQEKRTGFGTYLSLFNPFASTSEFSQRTVFGDSENIGKGRDAYRAQIAGLSNTELLDLSKRAGTEGFGTPDMVRGAISREIADRQAMKAFEDMRLKKAGPRPMLAPESIALGASFKLSGQLKSVDAEAAMRIMQTRQQIALEAPGVTDVGRLMREGVFGRQNIRAQYGAQRTSALEEGTGSIIDMLGRAGVKNRSFFEDKLVGVQSIGDLQSVLEEARKGGDMFGGAKDADNTRKQTIEALEGLIRQMMILDETEQKAIEVNDTTNKLLVDQLNYRKTPTGAAAYLTGALRQGFDESRIADQATIDVARGPNGRLVRGDMLSGAVFGQADRQGMYGESVNSFQGGFKSVFAGARQEISNFADVGRNVANSLATSFSDAFGNFVTGAKKAKDAFRDFILSVLSESARAFATKAVVSLLGMFLGNIGTTSVSPLTPGVAPSPGHANGGPIGRAGGGSIPTLLTGGEYVFPPRQASRIGQRNLSAINSGVARFAPGGLVRGGSGVRDDVFAGLSPGSYVIRKPMVERYGAGTLASLSLGGEPDAPLTSVRLDTGGAVSSMMATPTPMGTISGGGGTAVSIGVTINDNSTTSTSSNTQGGGGMDRHFAESMGARVKQVVLQTIEEQKRLGGMLRPQSNLRSS